ncbi:AraC family transcriptional regulator [Mycobacterium sp. DL440]|uniref:helix-turn-helix transcriptional regulator n=1 Tax=Mycobacterium sp. DL440 TaxID=2675523 RepID=UPI001FB9FC02|nr:AraC family transcriptional regulator [Mycobacterium sp. DL440]
MPLDVWNGERTLTPRIVLTQQDMVARGLRLRFATEHIDEPTDWCCFDDSRHLIYVHREGSPHSMETVQDWGPSDGPPRVGDVWVVPAGEGCVSQVQGGEPAGFCEIAVPIQAVGGTSLVPRVKKRDPLMYQLIEGLAKLFGRDDAPARLLKDSLAETLRLHIADTCVSAGPRRATRRRDVLDLSTRSALVEYLEDGLESEITLETLAGLAEMSVGRFIKAFAAAFHTTPHQYLLDRRIDRAKSLLMTTSQSIAEISTAVGFTTPNHFATVFRRRVGVSPSGYRQNG